MNPGVNFVQMQYPVFNVQDVKGTGSNIIYQIGPLQYIPTSGFYDLPIKTDRKLDPNAVVLNPSASNGNEVFQQIAPYPVATEASGYNVPLQYGNFVGEEVPREENVRVNQPFVMMGAQPGFVNNGIVVQNTNNFVNEVPMRTVPNFVPTMEGFNQNMMGVVPMGNDVRGAFVAAPNFSQNPVPIGPTMGTEVAFNQNLPLGVVRNIGNNSPSAIEAVRSEYPPMQFPNGSQFVGNYQRPVELPNGYHPGMEFSYPQNVELNEQFELVPCDEVEDSKEGNEGEDNAEIAVQTDELVPKFEPPDETSANCLPQTKQAKPYACEICHKSFVYLRNLVKHVPKHNVVLPTEKVESGQNSELVEPNQQQQPKATKLFKCNYKGCDLMFEQISRLRRHEFEHSNEKPFICKYCDMSFAQATNLIQHVQINHAENI